VDLATAVVDELEREGLEARAIRQLVTLDDRRGKRPQRRQTRLEGGQLGAAGAVEGEAVADGLELGTQLVRRRPGRLLGGVLGDDRRRQDEGQGKCDGK